MFTNARQLGKTSMINVMIRALYEEIMLGSAYTPPKFMSNQAPYRFTRAYGKRSNWVNTKRRNAR